jgi:molybdopterin synthase sulfur carrier subunit
MIALSHIEEQGEHLNMGTKIEIPTPLRPFADKQASVEFSAKTVGEALKQLTSTYVDLERHLYTDDGKLRSFVTVFLNDKDIRYLQKEGTPTEDGDVISIIPSIAGGLIAGGSIGAGRQESSRCRDAHLLPVSR